MTIRIGLSLTAKGSTSQELVIDLDAIVSEAAEALADATRESIQGITATGTDGHRLFNRTGQLASGVAAVANGHGYEIQGGRALRPEQMARLYEVTPDPRSSKTFADGIGRGLDEAVEVE